MIGHVRKLAFGDALRFISGQEFFFFWARRPGYTWKARMCDLIIFDEEKVNAEKSLSCNVIQLRKVKRAIATF
jgi:hypothetical protein